jgi:hypothetical protein
MISASFIRGKAHLPARIWFCASVARIALLFREMPWRRECAGRLSCLAASNCHCAWSLICLAFLVLSVALKAEN